MASQFARRDLTLDLARVACVVIVVFVHVLFTGVGRTTSGQLVIERTVELTDWFAPATWALNIMPLFFVVGGYAVRVGWASAQRRGESADAFIRARLWRLARPSLILLMFFAVTLGTTALLPLDSSLDTMIDTIAIGVGSPLWFLGAYMIVQALAPLMIRLHERNRWAPIVGLAAAAFAVDLFVQKVVIEAWGMPRIDLTSFAPGSDLFGLPNILFVWLLAQQIGFWMRDGWFTRRSWWQLVILIGAAYILIWALVTAVPYSSSMIRNQWPPTLLMDLLALIQAAGLTLLHRPLAALMRTRAAQGVVYLIGSRLMTTYLWHLPLIMVLTGIQLLLPLPLPAPGSPVWWWTRPVMLAFVLGAVWILSLAVARFEAAPPREEFRFPRPQTTGWAVVLFVIPPVGITAYGLDVWFALAGVACTALALWLTSSRKVESERTLTSV